MKKEENCIPNHISRKVLYCINEITKTQQKKKLNWNPTSLYEPLRTLSSIDDKGEVGEMLLYEILKPHFNVKWEKAKTSREKDWDIVVNGIKIEVKTATMGNTGITFQHEKFFKNRNYDAVVFLDFTPDELYITFSKKYDILWDKLHHRKVNGILTTEHKFDFSLKNIKENKINKFTKHKTKLIKTEGDLITFFEDIIKNIP
ncbi:MAG: hypothetical protein KJ566_03410 [Nanoarchaeota archaeon]|nr:hypothetical protein [Nanoarchaeota archaeon]